MLRSTFKLLPLFGLLAAASTAAAQSVTWNGNSSHAWNNPANWTPARVPLTTDSVVITGPAIAPHNPIVSTPAHTKTLTLGPGAVLVTADGGLLNVAGNFINKAGAVSGSGSGTVALVGSERQEIAGPALSKFRNLTIGPAGAFTTAPVSVERGLTLRGNLTVAADKPFMLLSSSAPGPSYVVNDGGVVVGRVTVQRYIDAAINPALGYRHFSSPVTEAVFGTLETPDFKPVFNPLYNTHPNPRTIRPFPTVLGYDEVRIVTQAAAINITDFDKGFFSPAGPLAPIPQGRGCAANIRGTVNGSPSGQGMVVAFVGQLSSGDILMSNLGRGPSTAAGWHLLGNPYPSPLDWNKVIATVGTSGLSNALYVAKSTGQYTGTYATYINGVGVNGGSNVIPVAQGFFVRNPTTGSTAQLLFTNAARLSSETKTFQRGSNETPPLLRLGLSNTTGACETAVYFEKGATAGYDLRLDASTMPAGGEINLATAAAAELMAVNALPPLQGEDVRVPLRGRVTVQGTYELRVNELTSLPDGYRAYLQDQQTGTLTALTSQLTLPLQLPAGEIARERFVVLFSKTQALAAAPAAMAALAAVYPNPASASAAATLLLPHSLARGQGLVKVDMLNSLGQLVLTRAVPAGSAAERTDLPLQGLEPGVYTVRATTAVGVVTKRLIVR